jgi:hypothetical protein
VAKTAKEQLGVDLPEEGGDDGELKFHEPARTTAEEQDQASEATQQTELPDRPEWLPDQYKTPEDLAAAHRSLQDRLRVEAENRKLLEGRLTELEAATQQQTQAQGTDDILGRVADEIAWARDQGDVRRELELTTWLQNYTLQQAAAATPAQAGRDESPIQDEIIAAHVRNSLARSHEDWEQYEPQIAELIQAEPWRFPQEATESLPSMARALESAYEVVKARDVLAQQQELHERGLSQADLSRARKMEAQGLQGASGRPAEPSPVDRELAEMKDALHRNSGMAAIRSQLG